MAPAEMLTLPTGEEVRFSPEDAPEIRRHRWCRQVVLTKTRALIYAQTRIAGRSVYMHRLVMGRPGLTVDHRDRDGLNNTRGNLRPATRQQQRHNAGARWRCASTSSRFKGVSLYRRHRADGSAYERWRAQIVAPDGRVIIKYATTEGDAALWYNVLALKHFGEFARINEVE